jgi:hypothetical protein
MIRPEYVQALLVAPHHMTRCRRAKIPATHEISDTFN